LKKMRYRKYVNTDELIFDFAIFIIFLIISSYKIENKSLVESMNGVLLFLLLFLAVFLSPMYLSSINARFKRYKDNMVDKVLLPFSYIITIFTAVFIVYVMPVQMVQYYKSSSLFSFLFFNFFFGIIALIIGWHIGSKYELERDSTDKLSVGIFAYLAPAAVIAPLFAIAVIIEFSQNWFLALIIACIILFISYKFIHSGNERIDLFLRSSLVHDYIFPFVMAFMLAFCHEIINEMYFLKTKSLSSLFILKSLFITGILPARIILLLSPPRKMVNIIIGTMALFILFYDIFKLDFY